MVIIPEMDNLPNNCHNCPWHYYDDEYREYFCPWNDSIIDLNCSERLKDCPLHESEVIYDTAGTKRE